MTGIRIFNVHYLWEDCGSMVLGALIVLTAWMVGDVSSQPVAINATIVGLIVLALGASEFLDLHRWEEGLETACGLWLIASPFIFGYADAGTLRYWHFVLGAAIVLLAVLELLQDWKLSKAELYPPQRAITSSTIEFVAARVGSIGDFIQRRAFRGCCYLAYRHI